MKNKWQLNRAGLLNFWYYDDEEFHFSGGKLLLRGSNGSGKSVTMQSLIPVLLDGRKSPDRLDPFGSKARKMEDYLLGEKEVTDRDERTGYLYLEYKRERSDQYLTTGIGLRAKRHSNLDFWGFIILDNRRIGHDLFLYKKEYSVEEGKEQKIPLTRRELENRLETGGKVVKSQQDYMELVNKHVFGFESLDAYKELVKLLIQLRSPKLSKDFKPTVIYEILNESLPGLSDEELRPLSDTIENMDQTKQQLDLLLRDRSSLKKLCRQYDLYNRFVLAEKADGFLQAARKRRKLNVYAEELQNSLQKLREQSEELARSMEKARREQEVLKQEESELKDHDVFKAEEKKKEIESQITGIREKLSRKNKSLDQKKAAEAEWQRRCTAEEYKVNSAEKDMENLLYELDDVAAEAKFFGHEVAAREFRNNYRDNYIFDLWKKDAREYREQLEKVLRTLRKQSRVKERHKDADKELADARKELDLKKDETQKWEDFFTEEKDRFLAAFHQWLKDNKVLVLSAEEIQVTSRRITQFYEPYQAVEVREAVTEAYNRYQDKIRKDLVNKNHKLERKEEEIGDKKEELKRWKEKTDPEPDRHPDTVESRTRLDKEGIPYVPFFAAVEFHPRVTPEQRERIEAAVTQMGLLDALIIPERHRNSAGEYDRVVRPEPQLLAHTLADYLYPTPPEGSGITSEDIDSVLRSILIDDTGQGPAGLKEDGTYYISLLQGQAPREAHSIYIGKESRKQYRIQEIERISKELEVLRQEYQALEKDKKQSEAQLQQLTTEYDNFPGDRDLVEVYKNLTALREEVKLRLKEVENKNEKVKKVLNELQEINQRLRELTRDIPLEPGEESYEAAEREMDDYIGSLQDLELRYKDYINSRSLMHQYERSRVEAAADVDELKGEINVLDGDLDKYSMLLEQVKKQLEEMGAEEIRARIEQVIKRLKDIPDEMLKLQERISDTNNKIKITEQDIETNRTALDFAGQMYRLWKDTLKSDIDLGLVSREVQWSDEKAPELAKHILGQYGELLNGNLTREKVTDKLNQAFYQEQVVLVEYRLTQQNIFEVQDLPATENNEMFEAQSTALRQTARRVQLLMEYEGNIVSPYYVLDRIDKDIELQKIILSDKDRELYEEIIMNSVGRIIRNRINRAEQWVKKINRLMQQRNTSSGLTFSIRWKPRTAEQEEEMDTQDLVTLLRSDPRLLKEEDINAVTRHFRSKIERAKEALEEKGYGETLHQMIKEILDYRQWFSFTLYYRKEGEQRRELTNNAFYKFSGGEKAMAMYIPLFSAAYSRYLEAREDAPYIISLDEAFAGVDENNIRDMFDLVENLGFNYIMNSQSLWGDYDTVSSLSIYELVRAKNAPYVTVVRYYWDGKVRRLLHSFTGQDAAVMPASGQM